MATIELAVLFSYSWSQRVCSAFATTTRTTRLTTRSTASERKLSSTTAQLWHDARAKNSFTFSTKSATLNESALRSVGATHREHLPSRKASSQRRLGDDAESALLVLPSDCIEAEFLCRPSKRNKSPYVADIYIPSLGREAICHVPNLDMGGKCRAGVVLLVKPQRDKKGNLLGPNAVNPKYNTPRCEFAAQLLRVDESNLDRRYFPIWVGAHPSLGEVLAKEIILRHMSGVLQIPGIGGVTELKEQVTIKEGTRSDFLLEQLSGSKRIVEVKSVVDTDYCAAWTLPDMAKGVVTSAEEPYRRSGIFPWGQSKQKGPDGEKVVSARAIKHVRELTDLVKGGGHDATVLFVVARGDVEVFAPNAQACPSFARYLREAHENGVQILVKRVRWGDNDESKGVCFDDGWLDIEWS